MYNGNEKRKILRRMNDCQPLQCAQENNIKILHGAIFGNGEDGLKTKLGKISTQVKLILGMQTAIIIKLLFAMYKGLF